MMTFSIEFDNQGKHFWYPLFTDNYFFFNKKCGRGVTSSTKISKKSESLYHMYLFGEWFYLLVRILCLILMPALPSAHSSLIVLPVSFKNASSKVSVLVCCFRCLLVPTLIIFQ